jgi:hypothetical protein
VPGTNAAVLVGAELGRGVVRDEAAKTVLSHKLLRCDRIHLNQMDSGVLFDLLERFGSCRLVELADSEAIRVQISSENIMDNTVRILRHENALRISFETLPAGCRIESWLTNHQPSRSSEPAVGNLRTWGEKRPGKAHEAVTALQMTTLGDER